MADHEEKKMGKAEQMIAEAKKWDRYAKDHYKEGSSYKIKLAYRCQGHAEGLRQAAMMVCDHNLVRRSDPAGEESMDCCTICDYAE